MSCTFTPIPASPDQLKALSKSLIGVGDRLEKAGSQDWLLVARAAALLDGLRLNITEVDHAASH